MKCFFLSLLAMVFLIACGSDSRSSRRRHVEHDSLSSGESRKKPGELLVFGDSTDSSEDESDGEDDSSASDPEESLSMEEAGKRAELRRICEFKEDHILSDEDQVKFFKKSIVIKGEKELLPIKEIIKEKEITGWRAWFELDDFKIMNRGENKVTLHNKEFIVPYKYDKNEEYGDWCPSEGLCIVRVIYNGFIKQNPSGSSEKAEGKNPLAGWRFMGDLIARIQFAGTILDFSACDSVD